MEKTQTLAERKAALVTAIETELPEFAKSVKQTEAEILVIHQDAFAADYQTEEYLLLGMAMKYAGLHGKVVNLIGMNRETLKQPEGELVGV